MCLAVPGQIVSIDDDGSLTRQGRVDFAGIVKQVNLAYAPHASIGDYVLVHAGFAIAVIDEVQARETLVWLAQLDMEVCP
ncbi:HypC/HybG/HupF family hydrogenase formation chaperone [Ralstonia chuxiongensis]|uniref:HypC/HybG/HupF family hydrogenase formation chaperone n=1 Tax=Ralstonia chuxiongensis TaxID=2957504 RepID=UPI0028F5E520|nr:HypC/HybG/HupF family hydrogenase formation chaperone [Ralstonia chuxiongensis]CAJ0780172.1 Hydrogenase maturation factor HybG [Ralstonia chuxiongensis]